MMYPPDTVQHPLDNPAWHALLRGNKPLANGTEAVKYFSPEVSPFVAIPDYTPASMALLHQTLPFSTPIVLISPKKLAVDDTWTVLQRMDGLQMVFPKTVDPVPDDPAILALTNQHVPQMVALTKLTAPGPFADQTIGFGHYEGIFDNDTLIAMAGQRLHPDGFAEISAVCTHPAYTGRGYARRLIVSQIVRMQAASETPFLHVRSDNVRAITVYKAMGFELRTEIYFYFLQKN